MEEPEALPVGAEGGAPVTAAAPAEPAVEEAEVPVAQPVVATQAPAAVAVPPGAAVPLCGGKGRPVPAERVLSPGRGPGPGEEHRIPKSREARREKGPR
jgi:hypothetical protein